jgi:hypothetical protein
MKVLLRHGSSVAIRDSFLGTPLNLALSRGNKKKVRNSAIVCHGPEGGLCNEGC